MEPSSRAWVRRWILGELSVRRVVTGALFVYACLAAFAWLAGDALLYRPHPAGDDGSAPGTVRLASSDGAVIVARYLGDGAARGVVLYSHGNAEDVGDLDALLSPIRELGFDVLAYDYEGYGASGGAPSERHLEADILAAYRHVTVELGVPPKHVVVYGRSLGSGPSVWLASTHQVGALVLESAFTSPFRVATRVRILPWDPFPNLERLHDVRCPVLVVHAEHDALVPIAHGRALFAAANEPKQAFFAETAGHSDIPIADASAYRAALAGFLDRVLPSGVPTRLRAIRQGRSR